MTNLFALDEAAEPQQIFGSKTIVRTLGLYQPYATLILPPYNKVETRWVRADRQAPFPFGWYLFYSTKRPATDEQIHDWSGADQYIEISKKIKIDPSFDNNGFALGIGVLTTISQPMYERNQDESFVLAKGVKYKEFKGKKEAYTQRLLYFSHRRRIEPFIFNFGKQGVGILPESEKKKIRFI